LYSPRNKQKSGEKWYNTPMPKNTPTETQLHVAILKQMVTLATSGFGLVAALAWNSVIQELVNHYIKPILPEGGSLLSLFIYAVTITVLAVIVTYNLSTIVTKLEHLRKKEVKEE